MTCHAFWQPQAIILVLLLQVATLVMADWLFLVTDVDSLNTANPATCPPATHITHY